MSLEDFLTFRLPPSSSSPTIPPSFAVLLTDTLESPGTFLVTYFIGKELRATDSTWKRAVLLVGLVEGCEGYERILKKTGIQLNSEIAKGRFVYVDGSPTIAHCDPGRLTKLVEEVQRAVERNEGGMLVVVDDFSSLLWAGYEARLLVDTFSYLRRIVSEKNGSLVVLLHGDEMCMKMDESMGDGYLFRGIFQRCDLWMATTMLSSQSRGELAIHRAPALIEDYGIITRSGSTALQYKLEEAGAVFSVKGLGRGFL